VHRGQRLWAGERIGTAGCTGWCTGTHLHFEVRRRGKPVNPMRVVFHVGYVRADRELVSAR
jgi:murein DD-endopeptidase MepM/ murein hydrolase activator NlpD